MILFQLFAGGIGDLSPGSMTPAVLVAKFAIDVAGGAL
jgi:hypothetical protein